MKNETLKTQPKLAQAISIALLAIVANQAHALDYTFSDLGTTTLGSGIYFPGGINNAGQVVASRYTADQSSSVPVVWNGNSWTALDAYGTGVYHDGNGINDAGQVAGNSYDTAIDQAVPVTWTGTTPTALNRINNASWYSTVMDLNNNGQGTGAAWVASAGAFQAVRWDGVNIVELPTLGGTASQAWRINNLGQIIGQTNTVNDDGVEAVVWDAAGNIHQLQSLGNSVTNTGWDINDSGQIVGNLGSDANDPNSYRPVIWNDLNSAPIDLGTLSGTANGNGLAGQINALGQIFGYSSTDPNDPSATAMTLWDHGQIINLEQYLPADLVAADWLLIPGGGGINDSGVIIGQLRNRTTDQWGVYMLTPTSVPVPGAVWLFGSALACLVGVNRRKQTLKG